MSVATEIQSINRPAVAVEPTQHGRFYWAIVDALTIAKRDLRHIPRVPEKLLDVTIQPIIFVLLFRYVFGGAISAGDVSYVNFLIPGILMQLLIFGGMGTGVGLAEDLQRGVIDRFRSLPMARSAVLAGRTMSDFVTSILGMTVVLSIGFVVGFRPDGTALDWIAALGLALLLSFTMSWLGATIGILAKSAEGVQAIGFMAIFPLTFASSAFVPTGTMPGWLRAFTDHQPVTITVNVVRALLLGQPVGSAGWQALAWCIGLLILFVPLSVWLYQRRTAR